MGKVITIDGPAASGKTTVSRELARRLGWQWVSTGAFYRGLAYAAIHSGVDLKDEQGLADLALRDDVWFVEMTPEKTQVVYLGQDVTHLIADEQVGSAASVISHFQKVRASLLQSQRDCQERTPIGLVAEGRDCGTVVFPTAAAKIYLTAEARDRAERRAREQGADQTMIVEAQERRDKQDSTRPVAPLTVPADAYVLDTTSLSLPQVIDEVEQFIRRQPAILEN